jgi:hypothetical protein
VRNPDKYNVSGFLFAAALAFGAMAVVNGQHSEQVEKAISLGALLFAVVAFALGLAMKVSLWIKKAKRPEDAQQEAQSRAEEFLDKINKTKVWHDLAGQPGDVILVADVIKLYGGHERQEYKHRLEGLYKLASACKLPQSYGEPGAVTLDWYEYDLCIIAARQDLEFAEKIKARLDRRGWRVYLDVDGGIGGQKSEIERVFKKSSWKCLALLSYYMKKDTLRKEEWNYALNRALEVNGACADYLIPIPLDEEGQRFMNAEKFLNSYAKGSAPNSDRKNLYGIIVKRLVALEAGNNIGGNRVPRPPGPENPGSSYSVAISYSGEFRDRVSAVAEELRRRLDGKKVFFDRDSEALLNGPDADIKLQNIYGRSELIAVFFSPKYGTTPLTALEWRVIREVRLVKPEKIMNMSPDGNKPALLGPTDVYSDVSGRSPTEIADLIIEKLEHLRR